MTEKLLAKTGQTARLVLSVFFILGLTSSKAQEKYWGTPYIGLGLTGHGYFYEGVLSATRLSVDPYLSAFIFSPTVMLGYENKNWYSGLEVSYYANFVPGTDDVSDLRYVKRSFSVDYYLLLKSFRFGIIYAQHDFRNLLNLAGQYDGITLEKGIGFSFGFTKYDYSFALRKEIFFGFIPEIGGIEPEGLYDFWTFRFGKRFSLLNKPLRKKTEKGPFNMLLGLTLTGNPLDDEFDNQPATKLYLTFGGEVYFKALKTSLYGRRAIWYGLETRNNNFKLNSQVNHVGLAYHFMLRNEHALKVGLHHVWNLDRSLLYLDYLEKGPAVSNLLSNYENFAVGLNMRYELSKAFDISLDTDLYYEADPILGTGFNEESLRLSLLYKL